MDLSEVSKLDAPAKVLKLSEALRIGLKRNEQCARDLYYAGRTCALGAIAVGRGWVPEARYGEVHQTYLSDVWKSELWLEIGNMNDHGVDREAIATWLESQGY